MKDIIEYKVVILDKNGNYGLYSKNRCLSNNECITDYTKSQFGRSTALPKFIKQGNIVLMNNNGFVEAHMPKQLSDEQLYELDLLPLKMDGLVRMKIKKIDEEEYVLTDKIDERFSKEVIQSYFNTPKEMKK